MIDLLVALMMQTGSMGANAPILCDFPGKDGASKTIQVEIKPRPSLKDQPGLYRVAMVLNGQASLNATAQPIIGTDERDMLVRGHSSQNTIYSIGLRDDGKAALNVRRAGASVAEIKKATRVGECYGHRNHIQRWLPK